MNSADSPSPQADPTRSPPSEGGSEKPTHSEAELATCAQDEESATSITMEVKVGGMLAGYRLVKKLGEGGMGLVFEAEDARLKRRVAMKVMKPEVAVKVAHRLRFLREAQAAAAVEHDHIVPILSIGEENDVPFIVMPFLKGEPLDVRMKRGRLHVDEIIAIGRQTAEGLAAAHDQGLIHRDIKPANIWLEAGKGSSSRVKILDFGLARISGEEGNLTQSGAIMGTPAYMAPEQARARQVDARADLWSLGVILYEMTTGHRPFTGSDTMAILSSLALDTPAPPLAVNPSLPPALSQIIVKLLEKDPTRRMASGREVAEALRKLQPENTVVVIAHSKPAVEANPWADIDDDLTEVAPPPKLPVTKKPAPAPLAASRVRGGPKRDAASGTIRSKKPLRIGAAILGLLALIAVIIVIIRDKDGKPIAKIEVPPGGSVEIRGKTDDQSKKADGPKKKEPDAVAVDAPPPKMALDFAGDGKVEIPALSLSTDEPLTVEAWVIPHERSVKPVSVLFDVGFIKLRITRKEEFWQGFVRTTSVPVGYRVFDSDAPLEAGKLTHVATVWSGSEFWLYIDGRLQNSHAKVAMPNKAGWVFALGLDFIGQMQQFRVSKTVRSRKGQIPTPARFESDETTLLLYHFDEGSGDVLKDASGNGHHGKIVGAKWVKADGRETSGPLTSGRPKLVHEIPAFFYKDETRQAGHHVSFSKDGNYLVATGVKREPNVNIKVRVYDPKTGKEMAQLPHSIVPARGEFAPEGNLLAAIGDKQLCLWEWPSLKLSETISLNSGEPLALAFSPDGRWLVWGGDIGADKTAAELHWRDRRQPKDKIAPTVVGRYHLHQTVFSSDSRYLAAVSHDGRLTVLKTDNREIAFVKGIPGILYSVSLSRNGKMVAISSSQDSTGKLCVYSVPDGKELASQSMPKVGHAGPFLDNDRLVTWTDDDGNISFIDTTTWKTTTSFKGHDSPIRSEAASPDGTLLATLDYSGMLKIWDLQANRQPIGAVPPKFKNDPGMGDVTSPFDKLRREDIPAEKLKMAGSGDAAKAPKEIVAILDGGDEQAQTHVHEIALSPDGEILALANNKGVDFFEVSSAKRRKGISAGGLGRLSFSRDGKILAAAAYNSTKLYEVATGKIFQALCNHGSGVSFGPEDREVYFGATPLQRRKVIEGMEVQKNQPAFLEGGDFSTSRPTLSADGTRLACGTQVSGTAITQAFSLKLWDLKSGKLIRTLYENYRSLAYLHFSSDGKFLIWNTDYGKAVGVNDGFTGEPLRIYRGHEADGTNRDAAFSPDGRLVASCDEHGYVRVWETATGGTKRTLDMRLPLTKSDKDGIHQVLFTPDGRHLLTRSAAGLVYVLRLAPPAQALGKEQSQQKFTNRLGMEFAVVPKGKSWLGGGKEVEIKEDFYLGVYEVTQEEWQKVMGTNPSHFSRTGAGKEVVKGADEKLLLRYPVENVSWEDCQQFIAKLNEQMNENGWVYRLPSEIEWEYACRGGPMTDRTAGAFDFYLDIPQNQLLPGKANASLNMNRTGRVGAYPANSLGLHDMHGNVWEWCNDALTDDKGVAQRVNRGGSWSTDSAQCSAAYRNRSAPGLRNSSIGLRLARVPAVNETAKPITTFKEPAFQQWMKNVAALPAEKQVEAVSKKLMELNPGFDGKLGETEEKGTPKIENGVVVKLGFLTDNVTDISPVRALPDLKGLHCSRSIGGRGPLSDLSPLQGMKLRGLSFNRTHVSDLSALEGQLIEGINLNSSAVSDLRPLRGMPIDTLVCQDAPVADLSPLKQSKIKYLDCSGTKVSELTALYE